MPMLDEDEFRTVTSLLRNTGSLAERFAPVVAAYERVTGMHETNPNAIYHHRLSLYGPPCIHCGKPLRTPRAKLCGHCMAPAQR